MYKKICDCYRTKTEMYNLYDIFTGTPIQIEKEVGICYGTRECEQCKCDGDRKKCDFYEEVRNG